MRFLNETNILSILHKQYDILVLVLAYYIRTGNYIHNDIFNSVTTLICNDRNDYRFELIFNEKVIKYMQKKLNSMESLKQFHPIHIKEFCRRPIETEAEAIEQTAKYYSRPPYERFRIPEADSEEAYPVQHTSEEREPFNYIRANYGRYGEPLPETRLEKRGGKKSKKRIYRKKRKTVRRRRRCQKN